MRNGFITFVPMAFLAAGIVMFAPESAEARRCYTFKASHNGTDAFHPDGAAGTAKEKLVFAVDSWKQKHRYKRVRIGKIRSKCGVWYIKYFLPHHTCTVKARVCRY